MQKVEFITDVKSFEQENPFCLNTHLKQLIGTDSIPDNIQIRLRQSIEIREKPDYEKGIIDNDWRI